jgi:hypothetical protein
VKAAQVACERFRPVHRDFARAWSVANDEKFRRIQAAFAQPVISAWSEAQQQRQAEMFRRSVVGPLHESFRQTAHLWMPPVPAIDSMALEDSVRRQAERTAAAYRADLAAAALLEEVREQRKALHDQEVALSAVEQALHGLIGVAQDQVEAQRQLIKAQDAASREARLREFVVVLVTLAALIVALLAWLRPQGASLTPPNTTPTVTAPPSTAPTVSAPPRRSPAPGPTSPNRMRKDPY